MLGGSMLSQPKRRLCLIFLIFLNNCLWGADEAKLFERFEKRANEEVLSREQDLQIFKPKFETHNEASDTAISKQQQAYKNTIVRFQKIELIGASLLSKNEKRKLVQPYLNQTITLQQLDCLIAKILQWYFDRGFSTTRAGFKNESFTEKGILKIYVVEGKIGKLSIQENGKIRKRFNTVVPFVKEGTFFCLRDYEQALDTIQRLPSLEAQLDVIPQEESKSDLIINVKKGKPISFSFGYDNNGSPTYGEHNYNMGVTFDDLAGLYDLLNISYHSNERLYRDHYSKTFSILYSIPCGNHLWTVSYSDSQFFTQTQGQIQTIIFEGRTQSISGNWDYILYRSRTCKTQIGLELNHKRIRNEIQGLRQITGCRNLTTFQAKLSYMKQMFRGWLSTTIRFIRGLRCNSLNASTDIPTTFHKFAGDVSFIEPLGNTKFQWRLQALGQYSKDRLYGSEMMNIGGNASIGGFEESLYSGECGGYVRNELCYRFNPCNLGTGELFLGYDIGRIFRNHTTKEIGSLSGCSCGWRLRGNYFNLECTLSKALHPRNQKIFFNFKVGINF